MKTKGRRRAPTLFEQRVYEIVRQIPRGFVTTYADVARAVSCRSAQAIGQALRKNPWAPAVPCHRVIASDGSLGGYQGNRAGKALASKRDLLAREGVPFIGGRLADKNRRLVWVAGQFGPLLARRRQTS